MAADLEKIYRQYNKLYFSGMLPKMRIVRSRTLAKEGVDGRFRWVKITRRVNGKKARVSCEKLSIAVDHAQQGARLENFTLLHEMAHVYVRFVLNRWSEYQSHGPVWKKQMRRLARIGAFDDLW